MIFAKDGEIRVDGSIVDIISDWAFLTNELFIKVAEKSDKTKEEIMRETIEYIIENQDELEKAKENA